MFNRIWGFLGRLVAGVTYAPDPQVRQSDDLLAAHNAIRAARGLPPLVANVQLTAAAVSHATWMADRGVLSHDEQGQPFYLPIMRAGYDYNGLAQNIASGQQSVGEVMRTWQDSPPHMANIVGSYSDIGFARVGDYWCVNFGSPAL